MSDPISDAVTGAKIPVGHVVANIFTWVQDNFWPAFDALEAVLSHVVDGLSAALLWPHPLVLVLLFGAITWLLQRNWVAVALVAGCALFLASDLSAYCTGTEVDVNGGSLIH